VLKRAVDLLNLPLEWDGYKASRISQRAVETTILLLLDCAPEDMAAPHMVPVNNGGVQLEWHEQGIDLEIEVSPSGMIEAELVVEAEDLEEEWNGRRESNKAPLQQWLRKLKRPR